MKNEKIENKNIAFKISTHRVGLRENLPRRFLLGAKIIKDKTILVGVIIGLLIIFIFLIMLFNSGSSVRIIAIGGCEECFDLNLILNGLMEKEMDIDSIKNLEYDSEEAKLLIEKYGIERIPAIIVKSKIIKDGDFNEGIFSMGKNYLIFEKGVPYLDLKSNEIKGLVEIKEIQDSLCNECFSFSSVRKFLNDSGVRIKDYELIDSSSFRGKKLVEENDITFLNSLLISKELKEYWWIFDSLKKDLVENEDYYFLSKPVYPYKELSTGEIKGKTSVIYLTNKSCGECFDVMSLADGFANFGVYIEDERYVDISLSEGREIALKYNITKIPTVIFSKEISDYKNMEELFEETGTIEKDGSFVFRNFENLNVRYQKLSFNSSSYLFF